MKSTIVYSVLMSFMAVVCATSPCVAQDVPCLYVLSPPNQAVPAAGGTDNLVNVNTTARCRWAAVSHDAWVSIVSGSDRTGTGSVRYTVAANAGLNARRGTMTIAGKTFTVAQASPILAPCRIGIPAGATVSWVHFTHRFSITASTDTCAWQVQTSVPWITLRSRMSGKGSILFVYDIAQNDGPVPRVGRILVNGKHFLVTQKSPSP